MGVRRDNIRNIAIIAHVDHGKTTLVDKMLAQSGVFRANEQVVERVMDSHDLEREKGITILAKNTAVNYEGVTINIIDTPGHADFGGEVERIMKMVNGVLLVVDAFEGCMPQTRFVLRKALEQNLVPVVVVNKIDRENARPLEVVDQVIDLFIDLGATEEQLEFPVVYASGLKGTASLSHQEPGENLEPLFKAIIEHIPAPEGELEEPLQMQVTLLDYNDYLGRIGIGRIHRGVIKNGSQVSAVRRDGRIETCRISKLFGFQGLNRVEINEASMGDIVAVAGLGEINVGETICSPDAPLALPLLKIDEPTIQMSFIVNNSPFAGREGEPVTSRKLGARLMKEMETDVSLRVQETDSPEIFSVAGRGELHLAILVETMRREGLEFQVSKPEVIYREMGGILCEPFEYLVLDIPEEYVGPVMEKLGARKGDLLNMVNTNGHVRLEYSIPARGLVGFRTEFLTDTRGYGIMNHSFEEYKPYRGEITSRKNGVLIAWETGTATNYGLLSIEDRGTLFIIPGTEVYEGMIVGENSREQDIVVNVCKEKALTNMRSSTKEETVKLKAPRLFTLEQALEYLGDDEYLEVTPKSFRLRKKFLKKADREKYEKQKKSLVG
ncbi:translational GTPase TypA [Thermanaerosceptrum fracticalcis]|uniref:Large ribosomal subunit assembly factor BipA n=1 Tax=Thermanaerosceptrum fracticalcis TaxID=1712410 RepID=A0A7G6E5K0_THEFR|nr:translational GTPase TypA [Thermanaerosceptrum fracticalcis]